MKARFYRAFVLPPRDVIFCDISRAEMARELRQFDAAKIYNVFSTYFTSLVYIK